MPFSALKEHLLAKECPLTKSQLEILQLMVDQEIATDQALAEHLGVSACTVKTQLARINHRLGTHDRTVAVLLSLKSGWVHLSINRVVQ
ncbi:LuxR C-terminal-related transcriptional regulator [Armatimonas sp.]|uniref:LuxR C-terminal-related transcriptional regulator n=1 Tax=Armatimonas sp. TaxID=1872638 RepID=UPI0037532C4D